MDRQLKKSHFYKFSLVCVFFVLFFRKGAYVIFSICADKGCFFFALATEKRDWVL